MVSPKTDTEVVYTVNVKLLDTSEKIGSAGFTLVAPSAITFTTDPSKWQVAEVTESVFSNAYKPDTKVYTLVYMDSTDKTDIDLLKISATIAAGTTGSQKVTLSNYAVSDAVGNELKLKVIENEINFISELTGDLAVDITKPAKGGTPETTITGTNYTGSITWSPAVAAGGKFAANTVYTAKVELTANTGYQFANGVNPTVAGSNSVTDVNVKDSGSKLEFKVAFPATSNKTLTGISIPGLTPVAVPTAQPNETQTKSTPIAVFGVYDDGSSLTTTVDAILEITTAPVPTGVSLDGNTLKVTNHASAGTVRVLATFEGKTDHREITITKDASAASTIVLTPPASTTVAVPKSTTPNEIALPTAAVYDQYGKPMTGTFSITYEIDGTAPTGVMLNTSGGKMKVNRSAQAGEVKIVGKLGTTLTSAPVTYTITREPSRVTSVQANLGYHNMPVPTVTEPGGTSSADRQFAAGVLDQYEQEMTGQPVTWRVTDTAGNPVPGVSIDDTGKLTVTNEAPGIKVCPIATCQGIDSNAVNMTLHRETSKDTFVEICDQVGDAPETSLAIPTGTVTKAVDYTAKVYDQYGKLTTGMVFWKLDKTYTGVELDTTSVSGSATLKVDNTAAPGTIQLIATCSTVGSTASQTLDITLTNKTPAQVTTAPEAVPGLEYDGNEQKLVTAGVADGGTMQYRLGSSPWSITIPTAKDAATYSVQYKIVGDSAHTDTTPVTLTVTIGPKVLQSSDLEKSGGSATKVYDGTDTSSITVGVKASSLCGTDTLPINGSAVYNSADVAAANRITFTPTPITAGNYRLAATEVLTITGASITPRDLTVTPNSGQSKTFGDADPTLHSTNSGKVSGQIPDFTGALSRAPGEDAGLYDITRGTLALIDHFSSGFKASNYTLQMVSPAVKFEITKAAAPAAPTGLKGYRNQTLSTVTLPAGWTWVDSNTVMSTIGDAEVFPANYAGDANHNPASNVNVTVKVTAEPFSGGIASPYFSIKATAGENGSISPAGRSSVRQGEDLTYTITPDKGYAVADVLVDGKSVGAVDSYTFEDVKKSHTIEAVFAKAAPQTPAFVDVPKGSYYEVAVGWAVEKGITNGTGNGRFSPDATCTRAQIVTFLWRAAGSPAPKSMSSFSDVPAEAFYAKAVAWAVEKGITSGTGEGKFSPDATCTRAQAVTFLYRAFGSPAVSGSAAFSDVPSTAFYADAVAWAAKKGITTGIGGGLFGSDDNCTRGQIVTFLWRAMAE